MSPTGVHVSEAPLQGHTVLIPRAQHQAQEMVTLLRHLGAETVTFPTIAIQPADNPHLLEQAAEQVYSGEYSWIIFTSTNAVEMLHAYQPELLKVLAKESHQKTTLCIASVGNATTAALNAYDIEVSLQAPAHQQNAQGLVDVFPAPDMSKGEKNSTDEVKKILLPRADIGQETLPRGLHALGWEVDDIPAYSTVLAPPPEEHQRQAIAQADTILFTSSSTLRNYCELVGKPSKETIIGVIGPMSHKTAEQLGVRVDFEPAVSNIPAFIREYESYCSQHC